MFRELDILTTSFLCPKLLVASVHIMIREAAEDTVLEIPKPHGQVGTTTIPVPRGVQVTSCRILLKSF